MEKRAKRQRSNPDPCDPLTSRKARANPPASGASARSPHRRKMEEALQECERRFRTSVEVVLDGFAILSGIRDKAGRFVDFRFKYINEAGCRMNGLRREEML